ncbi:PD-(D/E)XK nuclease family protein [Anaerococcus tetradius]|uniref:PD-(D/E)XK nuclease family protein n=1 Tax=Anaerococcus tetradius TaxID=33036 RepID=UPI0023F2A366|nr:PD-(D/E)XK nuclease family protein [Anaerococcus tetradius]
MIKTIISRYPRDISTYIYKEIEKDLVRGKKAMLIVPEQYTLQTDINFMRNISKKSVMDAKVLSFSSLKSLIIDKIGQADRKFLSKNAKTLLITNILQDINDKLSLFQNKASNIDFVNNIGSLISTIKDNNFDEEFFNNVENTDDPITKIKFKELKMIFDAYEKEISGKFIDSEDNLTYIIERLPTCDFLDDAIFYFDKFDSLSELKLSFIEALLARGNVVNVSLNIDKNFLFADRFSDVEFFDPGLRLYQKLNELEKTKDIFIEEASIYKEDIYHLAKNFEAYNYKKYGKDPKNIYFLENTSTKSEVENIAKLINYLVKAKNYRYRDLAIYISDEDEYKNEIIKVFNRYDLPVFMDQRRKLSDNHIIKTFLTILRLVIYNFQRQDMNYFLRSGLFSFSEDFEDKVIILQNFIKTRKIKGKTFLDDKYFEFDQEFYEKIYEKDPQSEAKLSEKTREYEIVNELRTRILKLLAPLLEKRQGPSKDLCHAIFEVIYDEDIRRGIDKYQAILKASGRLDDYKENEQVWDKFVEILEELVELMGQRENSLGKIYSLIEATARDINVGIIPPSKDHIEVTSFARAAIANRRINFALGLNDVFFPSKSGEDLIVGKNEKDKLRDLGIDLKVFDEDLEEREKLNLYKLITISDKIFFSYSLANRKSEAINKPIVLSGIMNIFKDDSSNLSSMIYGSRLGLSIEKYSLVALENYALKSLRKMIGKEKVSEDDKAISKAMISYLKDRDSYDLIKKALNFTNDKERLRKDLTEKLYKKNHFNVSEIENYSRCPYKYFVNYGLRPKIEESYDVDHMEVGNIVHKLFEDLSHKLKNEDIKTISQEDLDELLVENFTKATEENLDKTRRKDAKNKFILNNVLTSTRRNSKKLLDQLSQGDFEIYAVEEDFGYGKDIPQVFVDDENYLRGRIDRIDKAGNFVRIIDYKTGNNTFKIVNLLNGLDLQLLVYMMAVAKNSKEVMIPIGSFYMPLYDEMESVNSDGYSKEIIEKSLADKFRINGLIVKINEEVFKLIDRDADSLKDSYIVDIKNSDILSPEEAEKIETFAKKLVSKYIRNIKEGDINLRPLAYDANKNECQYCDFLGICKFDITIDQLRYRVFDKEISIDDLGGEEDD